jgi:hypothetical protein
MNYFEVKQRLDNLVEFRALYAEYVEFTNRATNVPAQMVRRRLEPLAPLAVDSLKKVGLGYLVTRDAPSRGGGRVQVNIIKAIFRDNVIQHFSLDEKEPLVILERGLQEYRRRLWVQKIQLFNPLFWLFQVGLFVARLPFHICQAAGYDTSRAESAPVTRVYLVAVQILFFFLLAHAVGLTNWFRFDIIAL